MVLLRISYAAELAPVGAEGTLRGIVGTTLEEIGNNGYYSGQLNNIFIFRRLTNDFILGVPIGSFIGGYLFNHFGSITSYKCISGFALAVCIYQMTIQKLINRFSKNDTVKEEVSCSSYFTVDPKLSVNDNLI